MALCAAAYTNISSLEDTQNHPACAIGCCKLFIIGGSRSPHPESSLLAVHAWRSQRTCWESARHQSSLAAPRNRWHGLAQPAGTSGQHVRCLKSSGACALQARQLWHGCTPINGCCNGCTGESGAGSCLLSFCFTDAADACAPIGAGSGRSRSPHAQCPAASCPPITNYPRLHCRQRQRQAS
jgi:hypothetical protein